MVTQEEKKLIIEKQDILIKAQVQLKKEFVGIDSVIDQVIASCNSWFLMPQLQEKPIIVNLWGLTGVGKSSLIDRLVTLINMVQKYYRFDLGNRSNSHWSIDDSLSKIYANDNGFPIVLAFDEFQHVKSIDEKGMEIENQPHRIIWEILDSGKFMTSRYTHYENELFELIGKLKHVLLNNVSVENGKVISGIKYFKKKIYEKYHDLSLDKSKENKIHFVHDDNLDYLYEMAKEQYCNKFEIRAKLNTMNGYETIDFLQNVLSIALSPKVVDCSKAIVFIMGNLDNAYTMSYDYNPDMDADEFHKQSLKINIAHIKDALRFRFRNEQIARLGNNHIIYPAFNCNSFHKIIVLELDKIIERIKKDYQIELYIDKSIHELIYSEGVFPTQGTRPVFTTIYQIVKSKLGSILTQIYSQDLNVQSISIKRENHDMIVDYQKDNQVVFQFKLPISLNLEKLRASKKDDMQALVAVHECGHAVASIILLKTVPKIIFSKSADINNGGFNYIDYNWEYISKKEIIPRVATYLGGLVAEGLIFGDDNITCGSESDIFKATKFTTNMLRKSGMGSLYANYQTIDFRTIDCLHDVNNDLNEQVKSIMEQSQKMAKDTLNKQKILLVQLSNYLSENRCIKKEKIIEFVDQYAVDFTIEDLIENGDNLFYRNQLKSHLIHNFQTIKSQICLEGFSLNKTEGN